MVCLIECARDRLHLGWTAEQQVPDLEVQVERRRTALLSNQESAVSKAISAAASTCDGFPGGTETGILSRDTKRWLNQCWKIQGADFQVKSQAPSTV